MIGVMNLIVSLFSELEQEWNSFERAVTALLYFLLYSIAIDASTESSLVTRLDFSLPIFKYYWPESNNLDVNYVDEFVTN